MPRRKKEQPADAFATTLRQALEHLDDALWLGQHSPLCTPYFLGHYWQPVDGVDEGAAAGAAVSGVGAGGDGGVVAGGVAANTFGFGGGGGSGKGGTGQYGASLLFYLLGVALFAAFFSTTYFSGEGF